MSRPTKITINLDALTHNPSVIKETVKKSKVWSVVLKANAYGHGLSDVWPTLSHADGFA